MPEKSRNFHMILSVEDDDKLVALAKLHRISQGAVVRQCISARYSMDVDRAPTCANMHPCLVSQMHSPPPAVKAA